MQEFKTDTGAILKIGIAPFRDSLKLKNVIEKELSNQGINVADLDLESTDVNVILQPLLAIDSSEEFYNAIFVCASRCTYNGEKITEEIFEDEKAREDYYRVLVEVLKVNLIPFFKGLVSSFKHALKGITIPSLQK